jgi:hypothetical protein
MYIIFINLSIIYKYIFIARIIFNISLEEGYLYIRHYILRLRKWFSRKKYFSMKLNYKVIIKTNCIKMKGIYLIHWNRFTNFI